jgi:hypothetical protein
MTRGFLDDDEREADTVSFDDVRAITASDHALCVEIEGQVHWLPQSQIHADSEVFEIGHYGKLVITRWIAEKKGLV